MTPNQDTDKNVTAKASTARRLLAAAIRMHFANEDELAIQAVASAAYDLLREANTARHRDGEPDRPPESVGNLPLLLLAHGAYVELTNESIWPEGVILWVYVNAIKGTKEAVQDDLKEFVESLENLTPAQRLHFCAMWIRKLKHASTADGSSVH